MLPLLTSSTCSTAFHAVVCQQSPLSVLNCLSGGFFCSLLR
ncbi:hypothetical protein X975_26828, partial [Stegodyphus mimosarum]